MASMIDDILAQIPPEELAAQLGTDQDTAMDAARKALPALLGGLSSNANAGGGDALGAALQRDHDGTLLDVVDPLASVDVADGEKIVGHIFGDRQDQVVDRLGATSSGGSSLFSKLLPLLAPLVMAWLAKKVGGALAGGSGSQQGAGGTPAGSNADAGSGGGAGGLGGGLGGLLGGLFGAGGAGQNARTESADLEAGGGSTPGGLGGGLGGLLGGLLGGEVEQGKASMPDLGGLFDILGDTGAAPGSKTGAGD